MKLTTKQTRMIEDGKWGLVDGLRSVCYRRTFRGRKQMVQSAGSNQWYLHLWDTSGNPVPISTLTDSLDAMLSLADHTPRAEDFEKDNLT